MNKKIVIQFLVLTFAITLVCFAIINVFKTFGLTVESAPWLYGLVALSALSPTIASYVVLKNNREVTGFREWIK
ncbi:MAG: CPBP family intramembrane metalloprotease, partial [Coriobacteriia bacterium]|nr:CPBP family intramembrane metalloprotease [Coriobacteriia bacterium]